MLVRQSSNSPGTYQRKILEHHELNRAAQIFLQPGHIWKMSLLTKKKKRKIQGLCFGPFSEFFLFSPFFSVNALNLKYYLDNKNQGYLFLWLSDKDT